MKKRVCVLRAAATGTALLLATFGCKNDVPELTGTVSISGVSGEAKVGQTLTAVASLGGSGEVSYQWIRGEADVPKATQETYPLTEADAGKTIRVRASRAGYASSIRSKPTALVLAEFEFTGIPALQAYLAEQSGGDSADSPVPLKLSRCYLQPPDLFAALAAADKYVSLDLSDCSAVAEWKQYKDAGTEKIVSLTLPDLVVEIAGGVSAGQNYTTFGSFASLKTFAAAGVQTVRDYTLNSRPLVSLSLPAAITIGKFAFAGCTALETVILPAATAIGEQAFYNCTALKTISLPSVTTIGQIMFRGCTALESLTLGTALPTISEVYAFWDAGKDSGGFTIFVPTPEAETALKAAIADTNSDWYKALKTTTTGTSAGKFMGVKVTPQ